MKLVLIIVLALAGAAAIALLVFFVAGSRMPRNHSSRITQTFPCDRATLWAAITDYEAMPRWWPAVKAVRTDRLTDGTVITWNKDAHGNEVPFKTTEMSIQVKLVRSIVGREQPFGGSWTFDLADAEGGATTLTLTEDGWIQSPVFRAVAQWIIGLDTTQRDFMASLRKHLAGGAR